MKHYSDITLERYLLNELPDALYAEITDACASDKELFSRIEQMRADTQNILTQYTPEFIGGRIRASIPAEKKTKKAGRILFPALLTSGAALALLLFFPSVIHHNETMRIATDQPESIRFKGDDAKLFIFRKGESAPEQLTKDSSAAEGDILQIAYTSRRNYGAIFSIDGRGSVTLHFPEDENADTALTTKGTVFLPKSYQLDDAPEFEKFYFIASDTPVNTAQILAKARRIAPGKNSVRTLPIGIPGTTEQTLLVAKRGSK